jgi:hypothetical protein
VSAETNDLGIRASLLVLRSATLAAYERFRDSGGQNFSLIPPLYSLARTKSRFCAAQSSGENIVIGRQYFVRQATTLVVFARSTSDPERAAVLIEKAADFLAQLDESSARPDTIPQAWDVRPENRA